MTPTDRSVIAAGSKAVVRRSQEPTRVGIGLTQEEFDEDVQEAIDAAVQWAAEAKTEMIADPPLGPQEENRLGSVADRSVTVVSSNAGVMSEDRHEELDRQAWCLQEVDDFVKQCRVNGFRRDELADDFAFCLDRYLSAPVPLPAEAKPAVPSSVLDRQLEQFERQAHWCKLMGVDQSDLLARLGRAYG